MDRWCQRCNDDINVETNQVGGEAGELIGLPCPSVLKDEVLSLNIAELAQTLPECLKEGGVWGIDWGVEQEKTYPRHFRLLGLGGERRHEDTEGESDNSPYGGVPHDRLLESASYLRSSPH